MTPEEAFDQFCERLKLQYSSSLNPGMIWKAAWLEATRQAYEDAARTYEDAARICDEFESRWRFIGNTRANAAGSKYDHTFKEIKISFP